MNRGKLDVVKRKMQRLDIDILGVGELKWTAVEGLNLDDHYIYYGQESFGRNGISLIVNERVGKAVLEYNPKSNRMISVQIHCKPNAKSQ